MKKAIIAVITIVFAAGKSLSAQVHVDINIGRPAVPVVVAADPVREVSYYYLPEAEAYYYVPTRRYYYYDDGELVSRRYLPGKYRSHNAYSIRHIAIREQKPYLRHRYYRDRYSVQRTNFYQAGNREVKHKQHKHPTFKGKGKGRGHDK